MVPHAGPNSRVFTEIRDLGRLLRRLDLPSTHVEAETAIVWDPEAWWALESPGLPSTEIHYLDAIRQAHRVLWRAGITTDFVPPTGDLSSYETVLIPSLYLISDEGADNIARYVESGGTLVVSFFSGVADENARVRLDGHPGAFRDILGITADELLPLAEPISLSNGETANLWSEHLTLRGALPLTTYASGPLATRPAITRNTYGSGRAFYTSTSLTDQAYAALLADAGLPTTSPRHPPGLELIHRSKGEKTWLFAINHTSAPHDLHTTGTDLETGSPLNGALHLPPGGHAIIRVV
jgi:Beta-galactosidase